VFFFTPPLQPLFHACGEIVSVVSFPTAFYPLCLLRFFRAFSCFRLRSSCFPFPAFSCFAPGGWHVTPSPALLYSPPFQYSSNVFSSSSSFLLLFGVRFQGVYAFSSDPIRSHTVLEFYSPFIILLLSFWRSSPVRFLSGVTYFASLLSFVVFPPFT